MMENKQDNSVEALLERMRAGYNQDLFIEYNDLKVEARLLPGGEMATVISNAKSKLKIPDGHDRKMLEGQAVMKSVLKAATTIGVTTSLGDRFLDLLTNEELVAIHEQYESKVKTINPNIDNFTTDQIAEVIVRIKKKTAKPSDFYMWQLAAIGSYFLVRLQAKDN